MVGTNVTHLIFLRVTQIAYLSIFFKSYSFRNACSYPTDLVFYLRKRFPRIRLKGEQVVGLPWIEKPRDADDHEVRVFYDPKIQFMGLADQGIDRGGRRLFRKTQDTSSVYDPDLRPSDFVLKEELRELSDWLDIKVYACMDVIYAETRKSPLVDGRVDRGEDMREVRRQIELREDEKRIVKLIYDAFGQGLLGLDMARRKDGKTIVFDVNGWTSLKSEASQSSLIPIIKKLL